MKIPEEIILLICGWSVINGIFLGIYLFFNKHVKKNESNKILGAIFFLISFKIAYPIIFGPDYPDSPFHYWYYRWIVFCYMFIGSLLHIYVKSLLTDIFYFKKIHLLYLIPICFVFFVPYKVKDYNLRFIIIQLWVLVFILLSVYELVKSKFIRKKEQKKYIYPWLTGLIAGIFIIWSTVLIEYFIELLAFFSFLVIGMVYILIEKKSIIRSDYMQSKNKSSQIKLAQNEETKIINKLNNIMEGEKLYLDSELSLPVLSDKIEVPLYLLSKVINQSLKKNFSEFVNSYRINEAKKKLIDNKFSHLSIAGIAYDCGFNSLSTFNTFFKKHTNTTPSKFKRTKLELSYHEN